MVSKQEHKQNGGPLISLSLLTQSRVSVAPLTEGKQLVCKNFYLIFLPQVTKRKIATSFVSVLES